MTALASPTGHFFPPAGISARREPNESDVACDPKGRVDSRADVRGRHVVDEIDVLVLSHPADMPIVKQHTGHTLRRKAMGLIVLLIILILVFGGGGFYVGPPYHYYGGGLGLILLILVLVLLFRR
jgi:hypothetical protein